MLSVNHTALLKNALQGTGFVRRGAAFFRVWGDGVLQVLKFERQRGFDIYRYELHVGIFSMYGSLYPQWFTSGGCIPRGNIVNFIGLRLTDYYLSPERFTTDEHGQFRYEGFPVSVDPTRRMWDDNGEHWRYFFTAEQQIHILLEKVLPWLNRITTQSLAAKAMYEIHPYANDSLRFDAHLAAGEWAQAEETMSAILKQHADAEASWKRTFSPEEFEKRIARHKALNEPLLAAYRMIQEKNEAVISAYLSDHYEQNCALAKFCMK